MSSISNSTLFVDYNSQLDKYKMWNPEDADGDGVKDGASLTGDTGKVVSADELNAALKPYGLQAVNGTIQSVDGFALTADTAAPITDPANLTLPAVAGQAASTAEVAQKLSWLESLQALEGAALMWLALSSLAETSMRDLKDAKELKYALQTQKMMAVEAEIGAKRTQIEKDKEEANNKFIVACVVAIISAVSLGTGGAALGAVGSMASAGYEAYSKNHGAQSEADKKEIEQMHHKKQQEMLQQGIDGAQSSYEEAKELFRLALKILTDHAERETQIVQTITRG